MDALTGNAGTSELGRLAVLTPLDLERPTDFAESGLSPRRIEHRLDEVALPCGLISHGRESPVDSGLIALAAALRQRLVLRTFHLVAHPQDLQLLGHRSGQRVHPDDLLVAFLQRLLVGERRVGDLAGEPAVLDTAQDAGGHLTDGMPARPDVG